ncbi:MAG: flagellin [Halosimplex sp.]
MGFSVSGSAAIIFAGLFIAFGMWYSAASNGFERVSDARQDRSEHLLAQQNSGIAVRNANYSTKTANNRTWYLFDLAVRNTGSEGLSLPRTDVLIDNEYRTGWAANATVDGYPDTGLWLPGEKLFVEFNESTEPGRVKVVAGTGVSDSAEVTVS